MKKATFLSALLALTLSSPLHCGEEQRAASKYPVVNVKEISQEMVTAFMEGEIEGVIFEFSAGTLLPFSASLTGNIINTLPENREPIYFSFKKTFYLCFNGDDFLFSSDLTSWSEAGDFFDGDIQLRLDTTPNGPMLILNVEVNTD